MSPIRIGFLALGLTACASSIGPTEVRQAATKGVGLSLFAQALTNSPWEELSLVGPIEDEAACASLNASAAIDGASLELQSRGAWLSPGHVGCINGGCTSYCHPQLWRSRPRTETTDAAETIVTLSDGSGVWTMRVEHLHARRKLARVSNAAVLPGDALDFTWTPATDVAANVQHAAGLFTADGGNAIPTGDGGVIPVGGLPVTFADGRISFRVPTALAPGSYLLRLDNPARPNIAACDGPTHCSVTSTDATFYSVCDRANCVPSNGVDPQAIAFIVD